jgi:hypothetical protein
MIHITLTGPYAGTPVCGIDRSDAPGDRFIHPPYARMSEWTFLSKLCPKCMAEWEAAGSEDDADGD